MSKLEEIKGNYARSIGYDAWGNFLRDANIENILLAMNIIAKDYAKAKLEEAAERATIWVETPINGTEFNSVERDLAEKDSSIDDDKYSFIEKIYVFKQSITETPLD